MIEPSESTQPIARVEVEVECGVTFMVTFIDDISETLSLPFCYARPSDKLNNKSRCLYTFDAALQIEGSFNRLITS